MPQRTAAISGSRPDLRKYERLMATMRKASKPSRRVMTSAWSMDTSARKVRLSLRMSAQSIAAYPTGQVRYSKQGARLVSDWCRTGVRLVSDWCQTGVGLVSDWCRTGVGLVSDWCRTGVG